MEKAKKKLAKFKEKETVLEEFHKSIADAEIAKGYLLSHGVRQLPGQPNATAGEETRYAFAAELIVPSKFLFEEKEADLEEAKKVLTDLIFRE